MGQTAPPDKAAHEDAKKAVNKATGTGPEGTLTENQLQRAASEYMVALRPQPSPLEMETVLNKLVEHDDKGELKNKVKTTDDVPPLVDTALKPAA